ncbi:hypothetical protein [Ideonella sp.]|uniref:hypothetical protein n=1 Tax=Ideonella sp. TaxID=1929293 RepID=UPI003BB71E44
MKKSLILALALASVSLSSLALPKVGYYKQYYSADSGSFQCAQLTANTNVVKVMNKSVAYFEITRSDGVAMACIPEVFVDADDTNVDGDPTRFIAASGGTALCTTADAKNSAEVSFDNTHVFWQGSNLTPIKLADGKTSRIKQRERQSVYFEFYSTTGCP